MLSAKVICALFLKFLSLAGFLYQVTTVARTFFSYKTTSKVLLNSRETGTLPNMQLCMRYTDIMDLEALNREEGTKFKRSSEFLDVVDMQANMTVRMVMTHVPAANETIARCIHRNADGLLMHHKNQTECQQMFHVLRYTVQSFVCYNVIFTGPVNFTLKQDNEWQLPHLSDVNELFMMRQGVEKQDWMDTKQQYRVYKVTYEWRKQITQRRRSKQQ